MRRTADKIEGLFLIESGTEIIGMVTGTTTVASGCILRLNGMVIL